MVLVAGVSAGSHSGGEVAMQMFFLCLPISVAVGYGLTLVSYMPSNIFWVWAPFFVGGLLQAALVLVFVRRFANRRTRRTEN